MRKNNEKDTYLGDDIEPVIIRPDPVTVTLVTEGFSKKNPITHSILTGPGMRVDKTSDDPDYNMFLANCSDATGEILSMIAGKDLTKGITTPYGLARKVKKEFSDYPGYKEKFNGLNARQKFQVPWYEYRVARDRATENEINSTRNKLEKWGASQQVIDRTISDILERSPMLQYRIENGEVVKHSKGGSILDFVKNKPFWFPK